MNQAEIQAKVAFGLGKAAQYVGAMVTQYRPIGSANPMSAAAHGTLLAAFDQDGTLSLAKPQAWDKPFVFAAMDTTDVASGDILVGLDTYFVARFEPMRPPLCVLTNRVVAFLTEADGEGAAFGEGAGFSGRAASTDVAVASGWPAAVIPKSRGTPDPLKLPTDTMEARFEVFAPRIPGVTLTAGMRMTDDLGAAAIIETAELQPHGWHLSVLAAQA